MSVVSEAVEGATGAPKKLLKTKGAKNKLAYGLGLVVLFLVVIRFQSQIKGLLGKIPVIGPMLLQIAGG